MIKVSWISVYLYCPVKLYYQEVLGERIKTHIVNRQILREAYLGFEEMIKSNFWILNSNMSPQKISDVLFSDVPKMVRRISNDYQLPKSESKRLEKELIEDLRIETGLIALKIYKIMGQYDLIGSELFEILFPPVIPEYFLENQEINLKGKIDKIELIDGFYYPITIKTGKFPSKGVWESDALQIAAYSLLMEYEFRKEILVGFVDYVKMGGRRAVVINQHMRNILLEVLEEMNIILDSDKIPEITLNTRRCDFCEYQNRCEYQRG